MAVLGLLVATQAWGAPTTLRVLIDQRPVTLNPRATLDAWGQRITALLYRGLTRIDENLLPQPALASRWKIENHGYRWRFWIVPNLFDQGGEPITASRITACLENYRVGKPRALIASAFVGWTATHVDASHSDQVVVELDHPDPYLPRNVTLLRYFRSASEATPCAEPSSPALIGSGPYRLGKPEFTPDLSLDLVPMENDRVPIHLEFVSDDNTKVLKILRGEIDASLNGISLSKTRWLAREARDQFRLLEREGTSVQYLAFNLRDPILSDVRVRRAIALAIDRRSIVKYKMLNFCDPVSSFLAPLLPEAVRLDTEFIPEQAEQLLDEAGWPRDTPGGDRIILKYKTTPIREGWENARIMQEMLGRVGIHLEIEVVDPSTFLASIRKGKFQLFSSRWVGVADGSILVRTLQTGHPFNRVGYSNKDVDRWLEKAMREENVVSRKPWLVKVQRQMIEDLPYLPLWSWNNALLIRHERAGSITPSQLSLSGSLEPLTHLR